LLVIITPQSTSMPVRLAKYILLYLWWRKKFKKKSFRERLSAEGRRRRQRHLPRRALLPPQQSAWQRLYDSNDDSALIVVTGFDYRAFNAMHDLFKPLFDGYSPWTSENPGLMYKKIDTNTNRGSRRIITSSQCLGLVLAWYRFKGPEYILQGWFGFTGCHSNVWLRFGRQMLIKCLRKHPLATVKMPSNEDVEKLKEICKARHQYLSDVYCCADGLKIAFQSCHGLNEQSMYYNGWLHGHFITNLFVYSIDGQIIEACVNVPGSVHDSAIATTYGVYKKLEEKFAETGGKCVVDSAFAASRHPCLIKSAHNLTKAKDAQDMLMLDQATSLRQASE
jgi:DDE superfamily endonuclease